MSTWTECHDRAQLEVLEGQRLIECQRVLIALRKSLGDGTERAQESLATFESSQALLESDLARIREERR
jgi:hypothetical protein